MDDLKQFDIRITSKTSQGVDTDAFMGVFQRWIQQHTIPGVLIDVADYGHVHHGHGTILIAHEYNLSVDYADGTLSLLLRAKRMAETTLAARIDAAVRLALKACDLLEKEPEFAGKLSFDRSSLVFVANDRLIAPNTDATYAALKSPVESSAGGVIGGGAKAKRVQVDPRERLTIQVG